MASITDSEHNLPLTPNEADGLQPFTSPALKKPGFSKQTELQTKHPKTLKFLLGL